MMRKLFLLPPVAAILALAVPVSGANPPAPDGATVYRQRCQSCHAVNPAQRSVLGPNLAGVVGRRAAATQFNYSPALKAANLTWTRANLDRYLSGPARMVPGTRMAISVSDAGQRAAILDFLARSGG